MASISLGKIFFSSFLSIFSNLYVVDDIQVNFRVYMKTKQIIFTFLEPQLMLYVFMSDIHRSLRLCTCWILHHARLGILPGMMFRVTW